MIIPQVVKPCLGQTNDVEIGGRKVVIKFELFGPEIFNIVIINADTVAETRMRHG